MQPILLNRTAVGLSRPSQGECGAFVRTPRRCKKLSKLAASARRGCPGQARAGRVRLLGDLTYATDPAQPDSRGLVPAIPRRMRSIRPHAAPLQETFEVGGFRSAWMPGTSPGKTREGCERLKLYNRSCRTGQSWACPGHPKANAEHSSARRAVARNFRSWRLPHGVDARDKPGHDARGLYAT